MIRSIVLCGVLAAAGCSSAAQYAGANATPLKIEGARPDLVVKKLDLLYISDGNGEVTVYTYWQKTLVAELTGFTQPMGECVDKSANVYIADYGAKKIVEYAHAGKKPLRTIDDSPYAPYSCSVDETTGSLAVANEAGSSSQGNIAVYAHASGSPKFFTIKTIPQFQACAYDNDGNLLASNGQFGSRYSSFAWLPKGGNRLLNVTVPGPYGSPWEEINGIQWDGRYYVLDDENLYRVSVIKGLGYYIGVTNLQVCCGQTGPFWIYSNSSKRQGTQVVGGYEGLVEYWNYPAGGDGIAEISQGISQPVAVTVSLGRIHE
ncbi:MAG TPA: hypothetical protein VMT95_05575 [Candidatus Binatia bacterium]|nr:hypothetical protein [Candidatus Binatia bacterium]